MLYEISPNKTHELIIYIASRLKDKSNYGATLLGKALCLIDSMAYLKTGSPITNFEYIKQEFGPTPEPKPFLDARDMLEIAGDLKKIEIDYFGRKQVKFIAQRDPDVSVFKKDELVIINDVIESISNVSASQISDYTHTFISWVFARPKEKLPFYTFLLTSTDPETKHFEWANDIIKSYKS